MVPESTTQNMERTNEFGEHKTAILDYHNNETEAELNLSIAFDESFERYLAGYISQNNSLCHIDLTWDSEPRFHGGGETVETFFHYGWPSRFFQFSGSVEITYL